MSLIPKSRCAISDRWTHTESYIFTAHKRSLGQGNVFTPVCHSVHGGGFLACITGHMTGGLHLGNLPPGGGSAYRRVGPPPPEIHGILWNTVNKRAVHILLDYILNLDFTFSLYFIPRGL